MSLEQLIQSAVGLADILARGGLEKESTLFAETFLYKHDDNINKTVLIRPTDKAGSLVSLPVSEDSPAVHFKNTRFVIDASRVQEGEYRLLSRPFEPTESIDLSLLQQLKHEKYISNFLKRKTFVILENCSFEMYFPVDQMIILQINGIAGNNNVLVNEPYMLQTQKTKEFHVVRIVPRTQANEQPKELPSELLELFEIPVVNFANEGVVTTFEGKITLNK
jgi:hypothetical protein